MSWGSHSYMFMLTCMSQSKGGAVSGKYSNYPQKCQERLSGAEIFPL